MFAVAGPYATMNDGTVINFAHVTRITQNAARVVVKYPDKTEDLFAYTSETLAAQTVTGIADFLGSMSTNLSLRSITPATAVNGSTVNAVLIGSGFQYDLNAGVFGGQVTVGGAGCVETFVNSNVLLINFTAPAAGTYDVVYTPQFGGAVTLTGAWVST